MELENWVNSIHSACAAAFARHRGKTGTLHLLQEEIFRLEKAIESVSGSSVYTRVYLCFNLCALFSSVKERRERERKSLNTSLAFLFLQDHKLKHMADLQQSVVSDVETKQQINNQIVQWEENLERLHCEQFRLRCYMASLQSGELPNPKVTHLRFVKRNFNIFIFAR